MGELDDNGNAIGHCEGRDSKDGEKYLLPALASRDGKTNKIVVKEVEIPFLKMKSGKSLSNHEASVARLSLIKTK